ncbi:MAG: GNAT family N-acetyltransferase [Candidatus Hodarchaeota archaeon]
MHGGSWHDPELLKVQLKVYNLCEGVVLVAEDQGTIVGEADLVISNEPAPFHRNLTLMWILVDPRHRRKQIAAALMHESIQYGKQNKCTYYFTWPEDKRSHQLYLKVGFEKIWNLLCYRGKPKLSAPIPNVEIEKQLLKDYPQDLLQVTNRHNPSACNWANFIIHKEKQKILNRPPQLEVFATEIQGKRTVFSVGDHPCIWVEPDMKQDFELIRAILTLAVHYTPNRKSGILLYLQEPQREIGEHLALQLKSKDASPYLRMNLMT